MRKIIKVLGTGCSKCNQMMTVIEGVVKENNIDASIEKVDDIIEIMKYNVLSTPVLVVNEEITIKGRIPSKSEVLELLNN